MLLNAKLCTSIVWRAYESINVGSFICLKGMNCHKVTKSWLISSVHSHPLQVFLGSIIISNRLWFNLIFFWACHLSKNIPQSGKQRLAIFIEGTSQNLGVWRQGERKQDNLWKQVTYECHAQDKLDKLLWRVLDTNVCYYALSNNSTLFLCFFISKR